MQNKYPIGILGATGMVGQRFIQLLEDHPWFEIAWLAASDRSSGKTYGEAAKWRLDTPLPDRIARMTVSPAEPQGAPKIIFAALDAAIAREMEPKFANSGCAVVSNSSAYRMAPNVPLVIPEINADHLHLIEAQPSATSRVAICHQSNCSTIGLVMALKPKRRCGISDFVTDTGGFGRGLSRRALDGHLGNVIPYIGSEEKMEAETREAAGPSRRQPRHAARRKNQRTLQPGCCGRRTHRGVSIKLGNKLGAPLRMRTFLRRGLVSSRSAAASSHGARAASWFAQRIARSPASSQSRTRMAVTVGRLRPCGIRLGLRCFRTTPFAEPRAPLSSTLNCSAVWASWILGAARPVWIPATQEDRKSWRRPPVSKFREVACIQPLYERGRTA
jgi:aspartate-semialdehyde dehydrogenase